MTGKLIGVVGYAGSGKTTVTMSAIADLYDIDIVQRNFSRPIIEMLLAMGIPRAMLNDKSQWDNPLDILCGKTIRHATQTLGTEWGRDCIGETIWTNLALEKANAFRAIHYHVVIDNVRFPSEMDAMRESGAKFIAMKRPDLLTDYSHESEQYINELQEKCDYEVYNDGSFFEAVEKMKKIILDILSD